MADVDVDPPPKVLCAELERVQIQFNFSLAPEKDITKTTESSPTGFESSDIMVLDRPAIATSTKGGGIENLEQTVEALKALPSQVAGYFKPPHMHSSDDEQLSRSAKPDAEDGRTIHGGSTYQSGQYEQQEKRTKQKRKIPQMAVRVLDAWAASHGNNLYPTREEKARLLIDTALSPSASSFAVSSLCSDDC